MAQPTPDPLVHPFIVKLARSLKAGVLTPEERAKPAPAAMAVARVPEELLPFIELPSLSTLAAVLKKHSWLYWHPLVIKQVHYLRRLRWDEKEWERLAWEPEYVEPGYGPPREVLTVQQGLKELVEAHVRGLEIGSRIVGGTAKRRPGPKGGLENPHPSQPWDDWVTAAQLDADFRELRVLFRAQLKAAGKRPGRKAEAKEWYRRIAEEAVARSSILWSALKRQYGVHHVGPSAPVEPKDTHAGWLDTSVTPNVLKQYHAASGTWIGEQTVILEESERARLQASVESPDYWAWSLVERWQPLDLDAALDRMLNGEMGRLGRSGKPSYLACAVVAALLNVTPEKIRDTLDNFRRSTARKDAR